MQNLLILYNPYYQKNVIDLHLAILKEKQCVAFGKIKSQLQALSPQEKSFDLQHYAKISPSNPLQLFLTDYANLYVAKVIQITSQKRPELTPQYYENLEVEAWFILEDLRELVYNDFQNVRDHYLSNFTTPQFNHRSFAIYGNPYTYPLQIQMKQEVNYFPDSELHFPQIYKSQEYLKTQAELVHYVLGEQNRFRLHPNTLENLVFSELEFTQNQKNPFYDFSGVVIRYAKAVELEAYLFFKKFFAFLQTLNPKIGNIAFTMQGNSYCIADIESIRPNLGSYKFLLHSQEIQALIQSQKLSYLTRTLSTHLTLVQQIRNEVAHDKPASLQDAQTMRERILGIGYTSIILDFVAKKQMLS